jgi:hypothetical protein
MVTLRHPGLALAFAVALASAGCASSTVDARRTGADVQPVARVLGDLDATASTMRVQVDIAGLRAPGDLAPNARAFVVWYRRAADRSWERLGSLDYDASTRRASLADVTIDGTSFELIVTAEAEQDPAAPSGYVLFAQAVTA